MNYEDMLKKARNEMPKSVFEKERFEIPNARGHLEGNKTVISNFNQIVSTLGVETNHLLKYILKELAAPGKIKGQLLVIGTKIPSSQINEKIRKFTNEYVLCSECGKPDTEILKEGDRTFLKCTACGAKHAIKGF